MRSVEHLPSRARGLLRGLLPVAVAAGAAVTCDSPTGPAHRMVALAIQPVMRVALGTFGGLTVDKARLIVVQPTAAETFDTVANRIFNFSPDSAQITASISVPASDTGTLLIAIQLLAGNTLMFSGDTVMAPSDRGQPVVILLSFVGPGTQIASIQIAPRDSGIAFGASLPFRLSATDTSESADTAYYVAWSTSGTTNTINANGLFRAGRTSGTFWVFAHTPTGIWDSTRVTVSAQQAGVPAAIVKVAGDVQTAQPGTAVAVPPSVKVTDGFGTAVSGVAVTFAVTSGGGSVTGASTTTNASGIATVGSWTLGATAGANTLTASVAGLTAVTFTAIAGASGPAILLTVPGNLIAVGAQGLLLVRLTQPAPAGGVTVTVTSDSTQYVTVTPGTVAFAAGDTLKSVTLNGVALGVSLLRATATGYTSGITGVVVTSNLIVLQAPFSLPAGQSTSLSIQLVPAAPAGGAVVTLASTDSTKLRITTPTVTIPAGQAFGSATVQGVAPGVAVVTAFSASYAPGATVVTVTGAGTAATLSLVSGGNQNATPGTQLPQPVVVKVADTLGTGVSGRPVTFAVATGGGAVGTPSTTSDANGLASTSWTLGSATGAQTITATAAGLVGSPLTISANVTVGSTAVTPKFDTLTALTATALLAAQAKDAAGGNLTGSFTWVSRSPAIATVNASTGRVTAVTNGSTYVVATEAGGTKDSALVVVQQRLASIAVTPSVRNLYLTTSLKFVATGVDGLGKPIAGITSFTWSTTAPAVATVDTAGKVVGVGLGTAQIKATSGTVTGVANVNIVTVIKRIAVVVDTAGATKTDTFSLASLGLTRRYRAIAHDTLDAVMSGIQFTWQSTNGSVALVPFITSDTVSATSAANGVTQINATAQGFTSNPGANLTVSQVLASIVLSPPATNPGATIAPTGTVALVARGKDANSRFISGGTFRYASAAPAVATVVDSTGVVTGVSVGTSNITATSGAITSNALTVSVNNSGPAIISFGRDTVSVGRGGTAQIPILLSKPNAAALTVNLTSTAFAHWNPASVVIPANQTSINATLVGDSAGTTNVTATDGSGLGYTAGGAVARVTANMRLTASGYAINTTDIVTTQVLLSDPSPAGGTYVTFGYSTPGIARVSPDPAFIPAGQLAADIQILAVAAGSTNITPSAIGVNGTSSSFTAYAPVLTPSQSSVLLGVGQYDANGYVYTPTYTNTPVPVALASSDSSVATVTPGVTIPSGSYYAYFTTTAHAPGTATITVSAAGWTAARGISLIATTPSVGICCSNSGLFLTSPQQNVTVYAEDSLRNAHYRANSLVVHLRSSDTTVIKTLDSVVTIQPGQYYDASGRFVMGTRGGTAYVVATASGHRPDSAQYTVSGAGLAFSWGGGTPRLGAGQFDNSYYVYTPNNVTSPLVVTLASSDSSVLALPASVTIPTGLYYAYFTTRAKSSGSVTLTATAASYQGASGTYVVTTPRVTACCSTTYNNFSPGSNLTIYSTDSLGNGHYRLSPLVVSITTLEPNIIAIDSASVTIDSGAYYVQRAHVTPVGVGTAHVVFAAAGHTAIDTLTITVVTPPIQFSFVSTLLGRRQHFDPNGNGFYVYTPDNRTTPLAVSITQLHRTVDTLTTTAPTITGTYYAYVDAYGLANGTDTLIVSATGYRPDTAFITVTTPMFTTSGLPSTLTTTSPPVGITVYATDSVGTGHYAMDTVVVGAVSSDPNVLKPTQPFFPILKNAYYAQPTDSVKGPGTASVTYSDSAGTGYRPVTSNTVTVTAPALTFSNGAPVLGMRQHGGATAYYVYVPNNVADSLVVHLLSTGPRVATVPDSVIIPKGSYYAYFDVTAQDTLGTIQIQSSATGYTGGAMNVRVTQPKFTISTSTQLNTTSGRTPITVYATDENGTAHYVTEDVTVTLLSSSPSVAGIDSGTVTILKNLSTGYYNNLATWGPGTVVGTARLTARDQRSVFYKYTDGFVDVTVIP